jgi:hypothetical protein
VRRREFITLLGATAACPLAARAQQLELRTVGYLSSRAADVEDEFLAAFRRGLSETGYVEGRNLIVEYRWTEGRYDPCFRGRTRSQAGERDSHDGWVTDSTGRACRNIDNSGRVHERNRPG